MCAKRLMSMIFVLVLLPSMTPAGDNLENARAERAVWALTLHKSADNTEKFPGSSWYILDLRNNSDRTQTLQAIQMPGGYAGSGKFFKCGLDAWNAKHQDWVPLRREKRAEYGGGGAPIANVDVKPGEQLQVCENLLPSQAGSVGQCVRFTFWTSWSDNSPTILVSKPFSIGQRVANDRGPCSVK
jgi:hypothetical protein